MDFATLRDRVHEYCDYAGYSDTNPPLNLAYVVNEALRQISTMVEYVVDDTTITTVADTAEYSLDAPPDWIRLTDVLYGTTTSLFQTDENTERSRNTLWTQQGSSTPQKWLNAGPNAIRLFPTPDTSDVTVHIRGSREADPLTLDADLPGFPVRYHDAIPLLGAWLHLKKVATGSEYTRAQNYLKEAMDRIAEFKEERANQTLNFQRSVIARQQEYLLLDGNYRRR